MQHVRLELRPDNPEAGTPTSRPPFLLKKGRFDRNSRVDLLVKTVRNKKNITEKSRYKSLLPNVQSIFAAYSPSRVAGCAITIPPTHTIQHLYLEMSRDTYLIPPFPHNTAPTVYLEMSQDTLEKNEPQKTSIYV